MHYLEEIPAVSLIEIAGVDGRAGRVPSGVGLAVVEVLSLNNLVDRFSLANIAKGIQFRGERCQNLSHWQTANGDVGIAITSH